MRNLFILAAYLSTTTTGITATCLDIGYYCPENGRYQRVEYIESDGNQYLDTGIPLNSRYDMEMTWQNTRFVKDTWASGIWKGYGNPMIHLAGMHIKDSDMVSAAAYTIDTDSGIGPNEVSIPFDTEIHTTYSYKDKGIWIDDQTTLKAADYDKEIPSGYNFLVGARQPGPGFYWSGRVYSFIFRDNGQTMAEFVPVYDTQTQEYGMFDTVSTKFFGSLGRKTFIGSDFTGDAFPCHNAPQHAHYTDSGTDNNCPWECDTDYARTASDTCEVPCVGSAKLRTGTISLNLYSVQSTHPSLVTEYNNQICYVRILPGEKSNAINLQYKGNIYHLSN